MTDPVARAREAGRKLGRLAATVGRGDPTEGWEITNFGRHEDGYFEAVVTPTNGDDIYVHRKHGSWMAPVTVKNHAVLRQVQYPVAVELQVKARAIEKAERLAKGEDCGNMPQSDDQQGEPNGQSEVERETRGNPRPQESAAGHEREGHRGGDGTG